MDTEQVNDQKDQGTDRTTPIKKQVFWNSQVNPENGMWLEQNKSAQVNATGPQGNDIAATEDGASGQENASVSSANGNIATESMSKRRQQDEALINAYIDMIKKKVEYQCAQAILKTQALSHPLVDVALRILAEQAEDKSNQTTERDRRENMYCYFCHRFKHTSQECRLKKKADRRDGLSCPKK